MRILLLSTILLGCDDPKPPPPHVMPQPMPVAPAPAAGPAAGPAAQQPLGPVPPGNYVNHVGNPAAGQWGPDGQWQWKDPNSAEANSTWKYLAAAGAGAAVGGLASYMLTRKQFEKQNPNGWSQQASTREVSTYMDRRGNPISKDEYERRRAQSERDKARYREQQAQRQSQPQKQQYRDKNGRFISKQEHERRQAQAARDRARAQQQRQSKPRPRSKSRPRSRSRSRRR